MLTEHDVVEDLFQDDLKPGTKLLHGQYVIEQFLNNGGFGITYLAKDSLNRPVVIKECFPEAICGRKNSTVRVRSRGQVDAFRVMVDMFVDEARKLARLSHPNIVGVHQVFEDNDTAYMAMDFVEGRDLLGIVESSSTFKPEALEQIVVKLLDAIEFIHNQGILHRDIAPDNILLAHDYEPVLIDFGAARETVSRATRLLGNMRTVKDGYSPHEFYVADAEQFPSSDLYSLAASLYHVMTRELPASAQDRLSAIAGGEEDPYVSIKSRVSEYSEPFLDAIDRALELLPKNRLQSAAEWRRLITRFQTASETRGAVSRPVLAIDNSELARKISAASERPQPKYAARKMRPASGQSLDMDSVFVQEDRSDVAPKRVSLSHGKMPYLATAAIVILAVVGGGAYLLAHGDQNQLPIASVPMDHQSPVSSVDRARVEEDAEGQAEAKAPSEHLSSDDKPTSTIGGADTPEDSAPEEGSIPAEEPERPAWLDIGATTATSDEETQAKSDGAASAPAVDLPAVVATETPETLASATIQEAAPVIIGKVIRHQVVADEADPALIAEVDGPAAEHLKSGQRLVTVNGIPVESWGDFQRVVDATREYSAGETVDVILGIEDRTTGEALVKKLRLPVVQQVMLLNGVQFERSKDGDEWATIVTNGNGEAASDLQPGDRIVALMPSNELVDKEEDLATILLRELRAGTTQFNFAVNRGDGMWLVTMRYAAN